MLLTKIVTILLIHPASNCKLLESFGTGFCSKPDLRFSYPKIKDPERRSPERTQVYIEARKQLKTGQLHPNVVEDIQKLNELRSSQDSARYTSLDNDALTQAYAPSTRPLQTPSPSPSPTPYAAPNSTSSKRVIAEGFIEPVEAGTIVHHRRILEFERKVNVVRILGDDSESLYLDVQGCATTIREVLGGFVAWPIYFIQF